MKPLWSATWTRSLSWSSGSPVGFNLNLFTDLYLKLHFLKPAVFIIILLSLHTGLSLCNKVRQVPTDILGRDSATISCSHSISSYDTILWYQQQTGDSELKLMGYVFYSSPIIENNFTHVTVSGDGSKKAELHIPGLTHQDSGMYYCAASTHSDSVTFSSLQKHFLMNTLWIQHTCV